MGGERKRLRLPLWSCALWRSGKPLLEEEEEEEEEGKEEKKVGRQFEAEGVPLRAMPSKLGA
jgi:hypothetical protein